MDADTKAELDAIADDLEARSQVLRAEATKTPKVLTDGVCRITHVEDSIIPPCVGYVCTDLGEKFPVFVKYALEQCRRRIGERVRLELVISKIGTRYVMGLMPLPANAERDTFPCAKCGNVAKRDASIDGKRARESDFHVNVYYRCGRCHYQMEVGP